MLSSYYAHSVQFWILGSFCYNTVQKSPVHIYQLIKKNRSFDDSTFRHTEIYLKLHQTHRVCSDSLSLANSSVNAVERTPKVFVRVSNQIIIVRNCNKLPTIPQINFVLCKCLEISTSMFQSLRFSSLLVPPLAILFFSYGFSKRISVCGRRTFVNTWQLVERQIGERRVTKFQSRKGWTGSFCVSRALRNVNLRSVPSLSFGDTFRIEAKGRCRLSSRASVELLETETR